MIFYTFPMSMLLASLLAMGRLSADSEITAMRAAGASLYRLTAPLLLFAFVISLATIAFNEYVVPQATWKAKEALFFAQTKQKLPTDRHNIFYDEYEQGQLKRTFYARRFDGESMEGVVVQEFREGRMTYIIEAERAQWDGRSWMMRKGNIYEIGQAGGYERHIQFDTHRVNLKQALDAIARENRQPMEMNGRELSEHIERLRESGHPSAQLEIQLHQKLTIPFASFAFALIGLPLGVSGRRSSSSLGLGLSILIVFGYYLCMFAGMALGQLGHLSPWIAAWGPNLLAIAIGATLLAKAQYR